MTDWTPSNERTEGVSESYSAYMPLLAGGWDRSSERMQFAYHFSSGATGRNVRIFITDPTIPIRDRGVPKHRRLAYPFRSFAP
jgi:hypothetical protein